MARERTGLVLQGGGARGAYQVGVLKAIAEIVDGHRNPFPIISGTSVGAINAAPLAASTRNFRAGVRNLERLWRDLHCSTIYDTSVGKILTTGAHWIAAIAFGSLGVASPSALLDSQPLRRLLQSELTQHGVDRAINSGALDALCITASSYGAGEALTFYQARENIEPWDRSRRRGIPSNIEVPHLMASSSLPVVFPAVNVEGSFYGDGALRLTAPLSPAIHMGADRLLVISLRDRQGPDHRREKINPSIGDMAGHMLDIVFNDNLQADLERLDRVNHTLSLMSESQRAETPLRIIHALTLEPSRDLRDLAEAHMDEMPRTVRLMLRSLGSWGTDSRLTSYLLFEPGYVGALIELAYEDTMARAEEIRAFLGVDS